MAKKKGFWTKVKEVLVGKDKPQKQTTKPKQTGTQRHRGGGSNNTGRGGTRSGGNSNTYNISVNNARSNAGVSNNNRGGGGNNNRGGGYNNQGNNRGGNNNRSGYNQASSRTGNQSTSTVKSRAQTAAEQAYQRKQESERRMQEAKAKRDAAAKKRKEQMEKDAKERREKRIAAAQKRREGAQTATNEHKAGAKKAQASVKHAMASAKGSAQEAFDQYQKEDRAATGGRAQTHSLTYGDPAKYKKVQQQAEKEYKAKQKDRTKRAIAFQMNDAEMELRAKYGYKMSGDEWKSAMDEAYKSVMDKKTKAQIEKDAKKYGKQVANEKVGKSGKLTSKDLSSEDFLKMQNAIRMGNPKLGNRALGKDLAEKIGSQTAYSAGKNGISKTVTGIMQGLAYGDVLHGGVGTYNEDAKRVLKDVKESKAYNAGYMGGQMAGFAIGGVGQAGRGIVKGAGEKAAKKLLQESLERGVKKNTAKLLEESISGKVGKDAAARLVKKLSAKPNGKALIEEALEKQGVDVAKTASKSTLGKAAKNVVADMAASSPMDVMDAMKMSRDENGKIDKKAFATMLALNVGLGGAAGAGMEAGSRMLAGSAGRKLVSLQAKANAGNATKDELKQLDSLYNRVTASAKDIYSSGSDVSAKNLSEARGSVEKARLERKLGAKGYSPEQIQNIVSKQDATDYINLRAKETTAGLSAAEKRQMGELSAKISLAKIQEDKRVASAVTKAKESIQKNTVGASLSDVKSLADAARYYGNTGNAAKAKETAKLFEQSRAKVQGNLDKMSSSTGTKYVAATANEINEALASAGKRTTFGEFDNGIVIPDKDGNKRIFINVEADDAYHVIIGHETTHLLEKSQHYDALSRSVKDYAKKLGDYDELFDEYKEAYKDITRGMSDEEAKRYVDEEVTAQFVGKYLFGDASEDFIKRLTQEPNVFRRIYDYIVDTLKRMTDGGQPQTEEARMLQTVKENFEKAYKEMGETPKSLEGDTKYSMGGKKAEGVDNANAEKAEKMFANGDDPDKIFKKTGWVVDTDGKAKFEFSDSKMKLKVDHSRVNGGSYTMKYDDAAGKLSGDASKLKTLEEVIDHEDLFSYYKNLRDVKVAFVKRSDIDANGQTLPMSAGGDIVLIADDLSAAQMEKTILHETQHLIQGIEEFSRGASPEYWKKIRENINTEIADLRNKYNVKDGVSDKKAIETMALSNADDAKRLEECIEARDKLGDYFKRNSSGDFAYAHTKGEWEAKLTSARKTMSQAKLDANPRKKDRLELRREDFASFDKKGGRVVSLDGLRYNKAKGGAEGYGQGNEIQHGAGDAVHNNRSGQGQPSMHTSFGREDEGIRGVGRDSEDTGLRKHVTKDEPPQGGSFNAGETDGKSVIRLTPKDKEEFFELEGRTNYGRNTREKLKKKYDKGEKVFLESDDEIADFIEKSVKGDGSVGKKSMPYGRVSREMSERARLLGSDNRGEEFNISGYYIELNPGELRHCASNEHLHTEKGELAVTETDVKSIPDIIDNFDHIFDPHTSNEGRKFTIGKEVNGHSVIVLMVSDSRGVIHPKNMHKYTTEAYRKKYGPKIEKHRPANAQTYKSETYPQRGSSALDDASINNSLAQEVDDVKFSKSRQEKQSAKIGEIVNNTIPKEEREYVSEVFDYIVDCLKKGDDAQAEAQAKALAEDFGDPNDVHIDYDARRELKEIQDSLREVTIHMPQSDGMKRKGAFKDFKEALGAYDPYILHIRKSTTGKNPSIGIDEIWKTLDEEHPGMFPKDLPEDEKFRFLADLSTRRMEDTDLRIPTPDEYIDGEYEAMARDILDEARTVANPKPAKEEVVNTPKQEEPQPEVEQPKESEESQPAAEQPKESEEQQVMAAEIPKSKKEQKEEIKAAERQDAIDRGIDVDAYDDAKVSYKNPQSMSKSDIDKEMKHIYFANKNAKTNAHTKVRNERKKALEDEIQRRKDEQPAYAALSDDQLADKDPGWSIANDDIVRDDSAPTEPAEKGTFKSVNKGDNVIMPKSTWRTSFRRLLVNSMTGFEDFAKANKDNKMLSQINNVQHITNKIASWVEGDRSGMNRKISGKGLNAIFGDHKLFGPKNIERKNDFTNYVTYKHAIDRLEQEKPVHMGPDGESLYTKEDYQKMMGDLEEKYGKEALESFTDDICGYFDDLLQMRVDSGLITQKFADGLRAKYKTYIPTMREGDDWLLNGIDNSRKQEFGVDNNIRKATGGSADIMDLYQSAMMITRDVIRDAEENELLRQYARALGADPSHVAPDALGELPSFAAHVANADGGWRVSFFQDGQMVTMPVDKQIAKGLREINGQDYRRLMNISTKGQKPMRIFKGLITDYNLIFGVRNGARDIQQAAVNSKSLKHFTANIPTAQASVLRKNLPGLESDPWMKSYEANGGLYSTFVRQDDKFGGAGSQKYVEPGSEKGAKKAIDKTAGKALRAIEAANSAIEATPRLAEYIGTIKKDVDAQLRSEGSSLKKFKQELQDELYGAGKELTEEQTEKFSDEFAKRVLDMASTDTIEKAARNAADITLNFSRNGVIGKALNMGWVPYFNPSVQGLSKTVRMFTENGAEGAKSLLNFGMKLGTLTMAPAVINEVLCADNRDYQNLATREKDSNFFIPLGDGKFVKIPKPRENSVLAEPVTYGLRYFMDKAHVGTIEPGEYSQWKDLGQFFVSMKDNIGPANPMNDNIFSPIVRLAQNKTWYGGSIESVSELLGKKEGELKNSDIADNTTSAWAIAIGQQKIGNTTISDLTHMSPKKIDDLMDSYLGVIYDLGISQTAEVTNGNPFVNQFIKDSVFSNKNGTELWAEFGKANEPKTTGGKIKQKAKDAVFGHSVLNINEKTLEAKDWLNQKGYDDITYSDAINKIREDKSFTDKQKENIIRNWKKSQNNLRHELIYGSKEVSYRDDPLKVIAKTVGVDKAMTDYTYTSENPETGKKNNQHLDAWKAYKNSAEYKKDKEKGGQKFIDFYAKMRWTNGRIGESKSYPQWMTASILAATEKGNNDALAKAYIRPDGWEDGVSTGKLDPDYQEKIVQRGKNYRDYGFDQAYYRKSQRAIFKAGRALKYEYTSKMNPWDEAMALSTHKAEFLDGAYYSSDTSGKVSRRMNYARCLDKKGYSTKQIYDFAKEYDLKLPDTKGMSKQEAGQAWKAFDDKVEAAVRDKYGDKPKEEQAAVYHVITDDTYHQPFGEVGDYSKKGDTGITDLDARENSGWGHRGRRRRRHRRGGWGHGGGGSGGGGGSFRATKVPETTPKKLTAKKSSAKRSSGGAAKVSTPEVHVDFKKGVTPNVQHTVNYKPYKAKAANLFQMKDYTKPSNLDDAYRKKAKKLREASRKKLS